MTDRSVLREAKLALRQSDRRQADRREPERVTWWRIAGLTLFVLYILGVGLYAAPLVLHGLAGR